MSRLILTVLLFASSLYGCTSPQHTESLSAKTWNFDLWGQLSDVSVTDIAAAVAVAKQSKDFTRRKIYAVHVASHTEIDVYYDPPFGVGGVYLVVERVHGQWREAHPMFFNA